MRKISSLISLQEKNIEKVPKELIQQDNNITINYTKKNNDNESSFISNHQDLINKIQISQSNNNTISHNNNNSHFQNSNSLILINEEYRKDFSDIDEIVRIFKDSFPQYSIKQILNILNINSFNIQNSYNSFRHFQNSQTIPDTSFTDADDYIIEYMQSTNLYKELINIKGEQLVHQRKQYLNK